MDLLLSILTWIGMILMWAVIIGVKLYILYLLFELVDKIIDKFEDDL